MAYNVGEAEVTILPNADRFNEILGAQLTERAREIGRDMGDQIADRIRERLALIGDVNIGVDTEKASLEVDKFLAETDAKAKVAGDEAGRSLGDNLGKSAAASGRGGSGLIIGAIAGGLIAGGPALVAAAGVAFGGLAALLLHNQQNVANAASGMAHAVTAEFTQVAQVAVPFLVKALNDIKAGALSMSGAVGEVFGNLQPAIDGVTHGLLALVQNALPGLASAVRTGTPVFQGLESLLASIGTGLGNMFMLISQHAPAMGTVLSALGSGLSALLTGLGALVSAGGELGAVILPPLAVVLQALADVLQVVAPILPSVALAFGAWKIAGLIAPLLGSLAGALDTVGIKALIAADGLTLSQAAGDAAAAGFGAAASAARGLEGAMGVIGLIVAAVGVLVPLLFGQTDAQKQVSQSADNMTQALRNSKGAIDDNVRATAALEAQNNGLLQWGESIGLMGSTVVDALLGNKSAMDQVTHASAAYDAAQNASGQAGYKAADGSYQSALAAGTNQVAVDKATRANHDHKAALDKLSGAVKGEVTNQAALKAAIDGSAGSTQANTTRLQGLANAASAGKTQISLLKGALDALTKDAITVDQAQIALTQAINAAKTALQGQKGALTDASGALDLHTQKGAAAGAALIQVADDSHQVIAAMEKQGATSAQVGAATDSLRQQFISSARQMGINQHEAEVLADRYLGIPKNVKTEIKADTSQADAAIASVQRQINGLHDKTITITSRTVTAGGTVSASHNQAALNARGNIIHAFAGGGIEPMQGGLAQIVPPNALRVIGDRVTDDEAYIPINRDLRSIAIWQQAGQRMGMLAPAGASRGGGGAAPNMTVYAQFGTETIEARAVRVVVGALDGLTARGDYNP